MSHSARISIPSLRTYNFPQGRVTDHRIGLTLYKIDAILDGGLDELIDALAESQDYIILLMKKRYVQPLDKRTLTGGTVEEFKRFLEEKTGKTFRRMK